MTYVVKDPCVKCKYMDCVEVCPVDCFYEGENFLVIHPDECIDCGVCEPECPVEAISDDSGDDAQKWIDIQKQEFKRLGIFGDWDKPYTTMAYESEAIIVREFHKFLMNDDLYCGSKPVMWSVVEKTALAEAEVE